ncbi:MAG: tRNA pseudouridine(55) synthase TruB [Bacilli bacterium]|nr:tRNA pseudouridine(55) synthase TruB [Bacilli bacterium]
MQDGILLIDKPAGLTSRQVDNKVQKLFHTRKVGHLGTLDPFATGLLVVAVNKGAKCLPYLSDAPKTYIASAILGEKTSTGDSDGELLEKRPLKALTDDEINKALQSMLGKSEQIPPMTSAIKVGGKALYKLAHEGKEIERKPRPIEVYSIKLLFRLGKQLDFVVSVSSGTYIRVLAEDIAEKLGTVAHLEKLRRIEVGGIDISKTKPLDEIAEEDLLNPLPYLDLPKIEVSGKAKELAYNGVKMRFDVPEDRICLHCEEQAIAVYKKEEDGYYHSERGLF